MKALYMQMMYLYVIISARCNMYIALMLSVCIWWKCIGAL